MNCSVANETILLTHVLNYTNYFLIFNSETKFAGKIFQKTFPCYLTSKPSMSIRVLIILRSELFLDGLSLLLADSDS